MENQVVKQTIVVADQSAMVKGKLSERIALFAEDGTPLDLSGVLPQTGENIVLTGYVVPEGPEEITAEDTVSEAIGKVTAGITFVVTGLQDMGTTVSDLQDAVTALTARVTALEGA